MIKIILCLISFNIYAGAYLGGSLSQYDQKDISNSDPNAELNLSGNGMTLYLGYKVSFLAVEGFYKNMSSKATEGDRVFKMSDTMKGLAARLYIFSFFNFKFGTMIHDASGEIKNNGVTTYDYESTANIAFNGIGINMNLGKLDVFVDLNNVSQEDDEIDNFEITFSEIELGARYHF